MAAIELHACVRDGIAQTAFATWSFTEHFAHPWMRLLFTSEYFLLGMMQLNKTVDLINK